MTDDPGLISHENVRSAIRAAACGGNRKSIRQLSRCRGCGNHLKDVTLTRKRPPNHGAESVVLKLIDLVYIRVTTTRDLKMDMEVSK